MTQKRAPTKLDEQKKADAFGLLWCAVMTFEIKNDSGQNRDRFTGWSFKANFSTYKAT